MHIAITEDLALSEIRDADKPAFVEYLNDPDIYDRTLRIPRPYTVESADRFFDIMAEANARHGELVHFGIRRNDGSLIGAVGFDAVTKGHCAVLGYWLAKPWWGRGIMTAVVGPAVESICSRLELVRIVAHVDPSNIASCRVLEKNGFEFEGLLRKHCIKDGQFRDSRQYAAVR